MNTRIKKQLSYDEYTVAIICPLEVEMSAARYMLDDEHARLPNNDGDPNRYILGEMSGHNVALGFLPHGSQGIGAAATVAVHMKRTFSSVQLRLLVGIGGGIPSNENDIRLGDVVVGMPEGTHNGVVQYGLGRETTDGFVRKGFLCPPPEEWRNVVVEMKSDHRIRPCRTSEFLLEMLRKYPRLDEYYRPAPEKDILFSSDNVHVENESSCDKCDKHNVIPSRNPIESKIFYGTIASGDKVIKDASVRDMISRSVDSAICFEMEAAGLSNSFPCIVIRGICDYADSHKNDDWHPYAAAVAAACAKELLTYTDPIVGMSAI